jgi:hypothetical protein
VRPRAYFCALDFFAAEILLWYITVSVRNKQRSAVSNGFRPEFRGHFNGRVLYCERCSLNRIDNTGVMRSWTRG